MDSIDGSYQKLRASFYSRLKTAQNDIFGRAGEENVVPHTYPTLNVSSALPENNSSGAQRRQELPGKFKME